MPKFLLILTLKVMRMLLVPTLMSCCAHVAVLLFIQALLAGAVGSFGLVLTHSLDIDQQLVIAARGQPMSFAVYPRLGAIVFSSEAQATRAAIDLETALPSLGDEKGDDKPMRIDLDDLAGEVVLLAWDLPLIVQRKSSFSEMLGFGSPATPNAISPVPMSTISSSISLVRMPRLTPRSPRATPRTPRLGEVVTGVELLRYSRGAAAVKAPGGNEENSFLKPRRASSASAETTSADPMRNDSRGREPRMKSAQAYSFVDGTYHGRMQMLQRIVRLFPGDKPFTAAFEVKDHVGTDISEIPRELRRIAREFTDFSVHGAEDMGDNRRMGNRLVAFEFARLLRDRMRRHTQGTHDGSLDVVSAVLTTLARTGALPCLSRIRAAGAAPSL